MLEIPAGLLERIRKHALETYPCEACGILVGLDGNVRRVVEIHRAENLKGAAGHDRFEIDGLFFKKTSDAAEAKKLRVIGFYHSHPDHPARPSPTDADFAGESEKGMGWPDHSFMILSIEDGELADCRSWVFGPGTSFVEEPIEKTRD